METYQQLVEAWWGDEPCILGVTRCIEHKGSYSRYGASDDMDYFGYTEVEYSVLKPDLSAWPEAEEALEKSERLREYFQETIVAELGEN